MMVGVLGKFLKTRVRQQRVTINKQALGRIVAAFKGELCLFTEKRGPSWRCSRRIQEIVPTPRLHIVLTTSSVIGTAVRPELGKP
jgi:hypothetical protein